ncbi:ABC transporter permease [Aquibacillus koreensis]|uniref:ABC transporter permease n=1 Tax=Aquibacillus koreensis TaxID=279446 RepID=A0A9X4AKJ5_9BACI|nr:ABC transporter permease [Aquibacillus koreensis]MCT2536749.1 ABC transporter permease [Aquibacillus koreensis]MDC3421495.1 ABC transporter permease [Aquibacillus koreensis]
MKRSHIFSVVLFILVLAAWELTVKLRDIPELILPKPTVIVENLYRNIMSGYLLDHAKVTLIEILGGFFIGAVLGIGLGFLVSRSTFLKEVLHPYIIASQAMPKLALAPLLTLWFGYGLMPKIVITALISFFPLFESTVAGLSYVDKDKLALFRSLRATRYQILMKLRLPIALPYLMSGLRVAIVLSVVGAAVSEFIGANQGLGAVITTAMGMMDTPLMFSAFILLTLIGILFYQMIAIIESSFLKKYYFSRRNDD